ncbi:MAG: glutathione S-transferase N-terminal domain-containing protein [Methylobacteriaceae bacterium]|nr:glutathione S-transferase N-terminal domain-containing protein [Methylobacteriaceae bacterium]
MYDLAGADIELRFSPFCWRTRFAVAHKRLPLETLPWRFTDKDVIARYGTERVPIILDGETSVHDSWHIAEHLEAAYPDRPTLFGGQAGKGLARVVSDWTDLVLHPLILKWKVGDIYAAIHEKDRAYFRGTREARFGKSLDDLIAESPHARKLFQQALIPLSATLEKQRFLSGGVPYYADYIVCAAFQWISAISPNQAANASGAIERWRLDVLERHHSNLDSVLLTQ